MVNYTKIFLILRPKTRAFKLQNFIVLQPVENNQKISEKFFDPLILVSSVSTFVTFLAQLC